MSDVQLNTLDRLIADLGDIPVVTESKVVRRRSRDFRRCGICDVRIKWHLHLQAFATTSTEHSALGSWQIDDGTG